MHYFQFNIKSYQAATAHLSNEEDLAYRRLIEYYYDTELPIPNDNPLVSRRLRVGLPELTQVLNEFFVLTEKGWIHEYCDMVILEYHAFIDRQKSNGKLGGRPKTLNEKPTANQSVSQNNPVPSQQETINHKPETINHKNTSLSPSAENQPKADPIPYEKIIKLYHEKLPKNPRCQLLTTKRRSAIGARWRSGLLPDLETWERYFDHVSKSEWLIGAVEPAPGRKRFIADIDYLINESNIAKISENKYHG